MARWARAWAPTFGKAWPAPSLPQAAGPTDPHAPAPCSPSLCRFYLDGSSLVLKGLMASDSGAYTCVAHNAAGEDARLHTVNVLGEPQGAWQGKAGGPTLPGHHEADADADAGCGRPGSCPCRAHSRSRAWAWPLRAPPPSQTRDSTTGSPGVQQEGQG